MDNIRIYDKIKWHYPDGEGCESLEEGKLHIEVLMKWLKENDLLSDYGNEIFEIGVDAETSVTSEMLNELGNKVLFSCYDKWVKRVNYGEKPAVTILNDCLQKFKKNK